MKWLASTLLLLCGSDLPAAEKPNVVVILCDDLGTGDVGCLNPKGKIPTPHIDRLAAAGTVFTDAHSASAVCTPTRYGLITGRYAWRTPLQRMVLGGLSPRLIEPGRETLASFLKAQGYRTACVGKWHLGMDWALKPGTEVTRLGIEPREQVFNPLYDQPITNGPTSVGFDEFFGISASLDMVPYAFIRDDRVVKNPTEDRDFPMMPGKPAMTRKGPTSPGFAVEDVLPALTAEACKVIAAGAKAKQPFFLYLPFASPHTAIAPLPEWRGKSGLNPYADFAMQQDAAVGEVLKALDAAGVADDTLVVFTSDNGCSPQADFPALLAKGHNPNHVYRGHKADIYEGGHRVPFVVRWPGRAKPGTTSPALVCLNDVFRTCADALGQKLPDTAAEDSVSFLPALEGKGGGGRADVIHHSIDGSFAIRSGDWKLCLCPGSGGWSKPRPNVDDTTALPATQLFDLARDIGETKNMAGERPEVVERLTKLLEKQVAAGRSTPGADGKNAVPVDVRAAGAAAHKPPKKGK